jgi:hypothetical protein
MSDIRWRSRTEVQNGQSFRTFQELRQFSQTAGATRPSVCL